MKNFRFLLPLFVLTILLNACKKNEDVQPPAQLIVNGDMEQQPLQSVRDWIFGYYYNLTSMANGYRADYTSEAAVSGTHSLLRNIPLR